MKIIIIMIPGKTPAINNLEIDTCANTPYTINIIDGGIRRPRVPEPANDPMLRVSS